MKRIFSVFLFTALLMAICSCAQNPARQVDDLRIFVSEVEEESSSYDTEQWEIVNAEFEAMVSKLEESSEDMTKDEKDEAYEVIGKYYGIYLKKGVNDAVNEVQKALDGLSPLIEGFQKAFED